MEIKEQCKKIRWCLLTVFMVMFLTVLPSNAETTEAAKGSVSEEITEDGVLTKVTFDDLEGKKAGLLTGTPQEQFVKDNIRNPEMDYYNSFTDLALALQEGKIDYCINSSVAFRIMRDDYPEFSIANSVFSTMGIGTIMSKDDKGQKLKEKFDKYIKKITDDGTLDKLQDYWLYPNDWKKVTIPSKGKNGTLKLGGITTMKPFCFVIDDGFGGLDIAIIAGFCEEYGYGLNIENAEFSSAISGVATGKYDLACGQIAYTDERAESVNFSEFYAQLDIVPIVRTADYVKDTSYTKGSASEEVTADGMLKNVTFDDLEGKRAGLLTGTPQEQFVRDNIENPKIDFYDSFTDLALALKENKIDYCINSDVAFRIMRDDYPEFSRAVSVFNTMDVGAILPKTEEGENLKDQLDEYIKKITEDGTLEKLQKYWLYPNDWKKVEIPATGKNGTLTMGGITSMKPFCFVIDNGYGGMDIAVIAGFCKEYGYGLKIENAEFATAISGVSAGKYDLAAGQIVWTKERSVSVNYSEFYAKLDIVPIVRTSDYVKEDTSAGNKTPFFSSIAKSFRRTFLEEHRYITILSGLGVTLFITIIGFLLANLFGALFCAMAMSSSKILRGLADIYSRIMQGTPVVVILMILYYIVFNKINMPGVLVACIAFGLVSGAYLAQIFYGGINSVDVGQREAALALGFSPMETFNGIVLPQAIRNMIVGYFSQLISLMKGTAVVGYIAVSDLTKAGDIIRSNTFEPFFPLISVALIYFVIACILLSVLKMIQKKLAPKRIKPENGGADK